MPERGFDSGYWADPDIQPLSKDATFLYPYLWTNAHCNQAGLYHITLRTISFETKITEDVIPALFEELAGKVRWYPTNSLVWVKNFVGRQSKSPKFLIAVAKCLHDIHENGVVEELLAYNLTKYTLSIPYPYDKEQHGYKRWSGAALDWSDLKGDGGGAGGGDLPFTTEMAAVSKAYEDNIGMLTPRTADRLREIVNEYPAGWFARAVDEALRYNTRNLAYIERILERWKVEGIDSAGPPEGKARAKRPAGPPHRVYTKD